MRIAFIVLFSSVIAACAALTPESPRWSRAEYDEFDLYYSPDVAEDGRLIARLSQDAISRLLKQFSIDRTVWEDRNDLSIFVHATANDDAGPGNAIVKTIRSSDRVMAEFHLLAPSAHPPHVATGAGLPFDDAYFAKLVTHEISTLFLEYVTSTKHSGWDIYAAPSWFVQGYQEYLGLTQASIDTKVITDAYHVQAKKNRERVRVVLDVENDYIDGALLVEFLHDQYGDLAVHRLLNSGQSDFWAALFEETGLSAVTLQAGYTKWLLATP